MEDDEDCYGFGALSDMFDDRSTTSSISSSSPRNGGVSSAIAASVRPVEAKKLDVAAMSRFWWSERKLQEFRRGAQRDAKEYHHLAAKFDGTRVDGGLGSLFLVPKGRSDDGLRDGGVLWIQAQASDSNAQARRKKEFQDITNRLPLATVDVNVRRPDPLKTPKGSLKSTATVFLSMDEILEATETTVQHTVQGIKFSLRSGHQFEVAFMPGPFYDARNRDELLHAFQRQQIDDVFSPTPSPTSVRAATAQTATVRTSPPQLQLTTATAVLSRSASPNLSTSQPTSRVQTPLGSPGELRSAPGSASSAGVTRDAEPPVDHRTLIRRYVQLDAKSAEAIALAKKINASRQYHVGPLASEFPSFSSDAVYRKKTVDELSRTLERMNQDWKMSEQERLLHTRASVGRDENDMFEYTDTITFETISSKTYQERYVEYVDSEQPEAPPVLRLFEPRVRIPLTRLEEKRSIPVAEAPATQSEASKAELFGLDIHRSSIITDSLLQTWRTMPCPTDDDLAGWAGLVDERAVADARETFTSGVLEAMQRLQQHRTSPVNTSASMSSSASSSPLQVGSQRRRSSSRRRSLDQPSLEGLRAEFVDPDSIDRVTRASPSKRPRTSTSSDGSPSTTRRRRRQSLVGTLDESLTEEKDGEGFLQPMDTVCPLCCDADAVVVMKPCGHSVCRTCWGRLARAEGSSADDSVETRQCPWDRETVTERQSQEGQDGKKMVATQAAASASERLHRWKDQVRRKHSMQLAEEAERKRQEDDYFVAMRSRVMSIERVQLAAERNYEVAQQIELKKMQLRTQRERELLSEDECTFQPQLFVPARAKLTRVRSRYRETASREDTERKVKAVASKTKPRRTTASSQSMAVFERLYARRKQTNQSDDEPVTSKESQSREERVDEEKVAAFLDRQTQFLKLKEAKITQLADETRCSFSPELSERTKQLSLERRAKPVSELLRDERLRRQRKLERCIGTKVSLNRPASPTKNKPQSITAATLHVFQAPEAFQALLLDLQAQEQRMKALDLRGGCGPSTGSPAGCAPPAACTRDRYSDCCGPASSARP